MTLEEEPSKSDDTEEMKQPMQNATTPLPDPPTGLMGKVGLKSSAFPSTEGMDIRTFLKHVALWQNPILSVKYLAIFSTLFYATMEDGYSYVGFIASILMWRMIAVAGCYLLGQYVRDNEPYNSHAIVKKAGEGLIKASEIIKTVAKLPTEKDVEFWVSGISDYLDWKVKGAAKALQTADTDSRMVKVVLGHLVASIAIFKIFSVRTLFFTGVFVGLTVPAIYSRFYKPIDEAYDKIYAKIEPLLTKAETKGKEIAKMASQKFGDGIEGVKAKYHDIKNKRDAANAKKAN